MNGVNAVAFFCDDFRQDINGSHHLIGIAPDGMVVPAFPAMLPKIAVFARVNLPLTFEVQRIVVRLSGPGMSDVIVGDFSPDTIRNGMEQARQTGTPFVGLIGVVVASPVAVASAGHLKVEMQIGGEVTLIGDLRLTSNTDLPGPAVMS